MLTKKVHQRALGVGGGAHRLIGQDEFAEILAVERLRRADGAGAKPGGSG